MRQPLNWGDRPQSVVGWTFEFTSGRVCLRGCSGTVLEVRPAPNATGQLGHVVIHTLQDGKTYRTRWSYFREHVKLGIGRAQPLPP